MLQLLLPIIYLAFISLGLPDSLLGSAWPSMYPLLGVPVSYAGILSMIISFGTIVSSLNSDRLTRALGAGRVTAISVGMTAAALFGFSISTQFWMLCLWAVPYGLGAGSVDAALNNYVALHYESRHMSWLHCMWGIGTMVSPMVMGRVLAGGGPWTAGYRYIALFQIALTAVLFLSLPLWQKRTDETAEGGTAPQALSLGQVFRLPGAKEVMLCFFCYCALETTAGLWASSYLTLTRGVAADTAASFASLFYIGITAGRAACGFLTLKLSDTQMIRLGQGVLAVGVAALLAVLLSRRLTGQLTDLTRTVSRCPVPRAGGDYPGLPPLPQVALDDEVGVLARAIASREEALRRFVQRESFFTGDVSHELRTPLTVMQGGLEVLELQLERLPGSERCAPTVERLQRTVRDMSATVGILLLLARRPENIELEPVDLALLVRDTAQGQDCFSLELPESREVQAQPALAGIVVKNLLDNARLYSENGRVAVRLDEHVLQVRNAGRIPEDLDIFARGVRARARGDATPGGSGLGLSLVRRACEQLGWSVSYRHSGENETLFEVCFAPDSDGERV